MHSYNLKKIAIMKKLFAILALAAMATSSNAQIKGDMNDDGVLSYSLFISRTPFNSLDVMDDN